MSDFDLPAPQFENRRQSFSLDASGRLEQDVTCRRCGYNLRGQSPQGVCSECGTPVGRSLLGDLLRFSDPKWVRSLASGMDWILLGVILTILSSCLVGAAIGAIGLPHLALAAVQTAMSVIPLVGYWKLTTPDPGGLEDSRLNRVRTTLRVSYLLNFFLTPLQMGLMERQPIAGGGVSLVTGLVGIVLTISTFRFGRLMALRLPDDQLARSCRIVMWLSVAFWVLAVGAGAAMVIFGPRLMTPPPTAPVATSSATLTLSTGGNTGFTATRVGRGPAAPPPAVVNWPALAGGGCVLGVLALISGIWTIVLFFRFRGAFHNAAILAIQSWAAPSVDAHKVT